MDIYVGNLPFSATEQEITDLFQEHGAVARVKIVSDYDTGRSKGFAFVTMEDDTEANTAIEALNGVEMNGRPLRINASRGRDERGGGGGGGGGPRRRFNGPPQRGGGGFRSHGGGQRDGNRPRSRQDSYR